MNAATVVERAESVGVTLAASGTGSIKVIGDRDKVDQLLPIIRDNKNELIRFLQRRPIAIQKDTASDDADYPKPCIVNNELRIPRNCAPKFRWWQNGQSIFNTLLELDAPDELIEQHIGFITTPDAWRRWMKIKKDREKYHGRH